MARTRGASTIHQDDGELVGKDGKPIPTHVLRDPVATMALLTAAAPAEPPRPVEPPKPAQYLCDETTWSRSMDGFDALLLMQVFLGEKFSALMGAEDVARLHPNARANFRRV